MEGSWPVCGGLEDVWASRRPRSRRSRPHLVTADDPLRVFTLLHDARAVLLDLGKPGSVDIGPSRDRLRLVNALYGDVGHATVVGLQRWRQQASILAVED